MGDTRRLTRRRVLTGAAGFIGGAALWPAIGVVFSSDRGIGFRDEGLYLLAADPPSPTARWVTPFGWHTAPFYDLVGHDIARFRTLAVWLLVVVGTVFGWSIGRAVIADATNDRQAAVARAAFALIGAAGAPLLTSGLLRTPGYNWVNLIGLMLAVTGTVLAPTVLAPAVLAPTVQAMSWWRSGHAHAAAAMLSLGLVFTVPAKPTSAPLYMLVAAPFLWARLRRHLVPFAAVTVAWGAGWTALAVATRLWPVSFLRVLAQSAQFPPLDRNQTIPGALLDVLRQPKVAWRDLSLLRPAALVLMAAALLAAVVLRRTSGRARWWRLLPLVLATVAAIGTAVPWPLLGGPNPPVRFDWYGTTNAGVLLFVGALLHVAATVRSTDRTRVRHAFGMASLLVAVVAIFGFGSAMSIYHQAALAAAVMWCAAAVMVASAGHVTTRTASLAIITLASFALLVSNVVDSRHHPFDSTDVAVQSTPVVIGSGQLLLDGPTASFVERLQRTAADGGFCAGDPLIGVVWDWTSTTAVALQAMVPEHLVLTIYGYPRQADVLDVTIDDLRSPQWHDGWVLTTNPAAIEAARASVLRAALDRLPAAVGRRFPTDYTMVGEVDGTQLWRPTDLTLRACG